MNRYIPFIPIKYIPSVEQAAVLSKGTAACFIRQKTSIFTPGAVNRPYLSVSRKDKHREKWVKSLLPLVIMLEGQISALYSEGVNV